MEWLQTWSEWERFEQLHRLHLAAFFLLEDGRLVALHNSLTSYLRRATRSTYSQDSDEAAERRWHLELANRYSPGSCAEEGARERIYHLVIAEDHASVLQTATLEWFREGAIVFVPSDELSDLGWICLRSAVKLQDYGALLGLLAALKEIDQRTFAIEGLDLAKWFLKLKMPDRACQHVLRNV